MRKVVKRGAQYHATRVSELVDIEGLIEGLIESSSSLVRSVEVETCGVLGQRDGGTKHIRPDGKFVTSLIQTLLDAFSTDKTLLETVLALDTALERLAAKFELPRMANLETPNGPGTVLLDVALVAQAIRDNMTQETGQLLADLGSRLDRKLQGARDAMKYSADPVSQAANHLLS